MKISGETILVGTTCFVAGIATLAFDLPALALDNLIRIGSSPVGILSVTATTAMLATGVIAGRRQARHGAARSDCPGWSRGTLMDRSRNLAMYKIMERELNDKGWPLCEEDAAAFTYGISGELSRSQSEDLDPLLVEAMVLAIGAFSVSGSSRHVSLLRSIHSGQEALKAFSRDLRLAFPVLDRPTVLERTGRAAIAYAHLQAVETIGRPIPTHAASWLKDIDRVTWYSFLNMARTDIDSYFQEGLSASLHALYDGQGVDRAADRIAMHVVERHVDRNGASPAQPRPA